jgi:polyphosphate glucokinase
LVSLENGVYHLPDWQIDPITRSASLEQYQAAFTGILDRFTDYSLVGIDFPTIVKDDQVLDTRRKLFALWQWLQREQLAPKARQGFVLNDADAAGIAEVYRPEAANLRKGVTIVLTLGTGIGSAIFNDGKLHPNTELSLLEVNGMTAEQFAASSVIAREGITLDAWVVRLQRVLSVIEEVLMPDHLVLGGGISADYDQFGPRLITTADLQPAYYRNSAGIIGSAMYAATSLEHN